MVTFVGAEQVMCDLWIKGRLSLYADDLNDIAPGLATRVFDGAAPRDAQWPCIIFQCQQPPQDVRGVGTFTVMVDTLYLVKAVAQVEDYAPLAPIARVINTALVTPDGGMVSDGHVFAGVRDRQFSMVEPGDGSQFRHLGGIYHIQAQG